MKPTTRIAIANLLSALGAAFQAFATELGEGSTEAPQITTPETPKTRKPRGSATTTTTEPISTTAAPAGKTLDELKAIIKPAVEAGQGAEVKAVIAKYATNLKELEGKPEHHEAFEKEIAALSY